jgi:uncharacterized protein (UPF0548 family)
LFSFREPSGDAIRRFLSSQKDLPFSYKEIGASREGGAPPGYAVDSYWVKLGEGPEVYERAVEALRGWRQLDLGWVRLFPPDAPIEVGTTVGVCARHYGFWSLNPARIVYLIEETGDVERFGFGYGTLPGHAERGEERFSVEWNREDGSVHYDEHRLLQTQTFPGMARLPVRPCAAEAFRPGLEEGDARRGGRVEPGLSTRQSC